MSQTESRRLSASSCQNDLTPGLNLASPSGLCENDQLDVGKCGDADLQQPRCDGEGFCVGDKHWRPLAAMMDRAASTKLDSQADSDGIVETTTNMDIYPSSDFKSPEPMILAEPPKLRRALAYMEFDGDCEPDLSEKLFTCHLCNTTKCGLCDETMHLCHKDRTAGQIATGPTGRLRARVCRVLKENTLHKLTGRETSSHTANTDEGDSSARWEESRPSDLSDRSSKAGSYRFLYDEYTNKHRPQYDLFHQFTMNDLAVDSGSANAQPVRNKSS
ncbi:hypothetical protein FBUS_08380 [Fasciolopsis buskii]|uniref:Uncharacterized protein n=1 Tax=Fasciolopsis buskii TaxID=27845 RepID=A0A8E0RVM2_9TREM|nr:hypothetical protein FBUS_08380 [Fasciolopsis buski]